MNSLFRDGARLACSVIAVIGATGCGGGAPVATRPSPGAMRLASRAQLRSGIDSLLADPMWRNANWGILVVDPVRGDTLYSHNAGKLFMPASNEKLLTGSSALAQLGADYRFSTWFVSSAPIANGVLTGDLVVVGHGDPSMSDAMMGDAMKPLRLAADSLYALGIREIKGVLAKGGNAFGGGAHLADAAPGVLQHDLAVCVQSEPAVNAIEQSRAKRDFQFGA